ncbi:MAG: aminotransferase class V-fold PLP-dependent enzyme [Gammaproteobacteria bacterium]|nr:aminotransferase class V-fold PLP-dependent enzyme [Gammaproteobacteria bacterium]
MPAASYGIAVAARNLPVTAGSTILTLADQFPSNVYAWRTLARQRGARLAQIEVMPGQALNETLLRALHDHGEALSIVALPHCRWTDGALIDLEAVGALCRQHGAALVLDLTQSAGALPIDLGAVDPDFAVTACYKWLLGPYALGFLHVADRWLDGEPLEQGWIGRAGSEDFSRLVDYTDRFAEGAVRFDMGERSSFHLMPMAVAALEQLLDWGVEDIARTLFAKTERIVDFTLERGAGLGLIAPSRTHRAGHFLGLSRPQGFPGDLLQTLRARDIHLSQRGNALRVTPHVYNDDEDLERLFDALLQVLTPA